MKSMKRILAFGVLFILAVIGVACSADTESSQEPAKLVVASSQVPHSEILEHVKPILKKEGVTLEIEVLQDYVLPNKMVEEEQADANFFQHIPYMEETNAKSNYNLVKVTGVHIEPLGGYSKKVKQISQLPAGSTIAIPNDPSNLTRALLLLDAHRVITLDNRQGEKTEQNVKDLKGHQLKLVEAALLPRILDQVELAVINTNYALQAELNPLEDNLIIEDKNSPYVNILATKKGNEQNEALQKLKKVLNSDQVKQFIEEKYKGAVVPAF